MNQNAIFCTQRSPLYTWSKKKKFCYLTEELAQSRVHTNIFSINFQIFPDFWPFWPYLIIPGLLCRPIVTRGDPMDPSHGYPLLFLAKFLPILYPLPSEINLAYSKYPTDTVTCCFRKIYSTSRKKISKRDCFL